MRNSHRNDVNMIFMNNSVVAYCLEAPCYSASSKLEDHPTHSRTVKPSSYSKYEVSHSRVLSCCCWFPTRNQRPPAGRRHSPGTLPNCSWRSRRWRARRRPNRFEFCCRQNRRSPTGRFPAAHANTHIIISIPVMTYHAYKAEVVTLRQEEAVASLFRERLEFDKFPSDPIAGFRGEEKGRRKGKERVGKERKGAGEKERNERRYNGEEKRGDRERKGKLGEEKAKKQAERGHLNTASMFD